MLLAVQLSGLFVFTTPQRRQLSHLVRLVDDLLDLSRINSDKVTLQKEPVLLATVVSQALETVRPLIQEAGHQLTVELPSGLLKVNADQIRLSQAFTNLLNNACKFTPAGGRISLKAVRASGEVRIAIGDSGPGVPEELRSNIFQMFTQANQSVAPQHAGLGIGLALVKRLVEMHEGQVSVADNPTGVGSEFTVRLPLSVSNGLDVPGESDGEEGTKQSALECSEPAARMNIENPRRLLIVDDNMDSAESLSLLMRLSGHSVQTAHDGQTALEAADTFRPDVMLLDIGLPSLNGYEVARRVRKQTWGANVILVAITGWGQAEDKDRSKEAGFDFHLVKPVDIQALIRLLRSGGNSAEAAACGAEPASVSPINR